MIVSRFQKMLLFFFIVTGLVATTAEANFDYTIINNQIIVRSVSEGSSSTDEYCLSWRLSVETRNIRSWNTVPLECELYIGNYMLGSQYTQDSKLVTKEAFLYAESLDLSDDVKNVWIFDIDETALSNLPYYARYGFGVQPYDPVLFEKWILTESAPALQKSLKLYKKLLSLGIKIVFISERCEDKRSATEFNLKYVGYRTWEHILLKQADFSGTAVEYKSVQRQKLVDAGYRIVGNIGDQWTDLLGLNIGERTFKLPNPMYSVS